MKSNRATLLWALPFSGGVVLFAPDLVDFVLGDDWDPAVVLLQGLAAPALLQQLGFNWFAFYRAHGDPRPPAIEAVSARSRSRRSPSPGSRCGVPTASSPGGSRRSRSRSSCAGALHPRAAARRAAAARWSAAAALPLAAGAAAALALRLALWGGDADRAAGGRRGRALRSRSSGRGSCAPSAGCSPSCWAPGSPARGQQRAGQHDGDERQRGHLPVPVDGAVEGPDRQRRGRAGGQDRIGPVRGRGAPAPTPPSSAASSARPTSPSSANVSSSSECASRTTSSIVALAQPLHAEAARADARQRVVGAGVHRHAPVVVAVGAQGAEALVASRR